MKRRVAITGLGAVTPFGVGIEPLWNALTEGRSAIGPIKAFDASMFRAPLAAEVPPDFSVRDFVPKSYRKATKVMARDIEFAVAAARVAIDDGRLITRAVIEDDSEPTYPPSRVGCHVGAGFIVAEINELATALSTAREESGGFSYKVWGESGMNNLTPLWMLKYLPNMLACHVTILHDAQGPSNTITCSEASGLLSIGESRAVVERGHADACFSGSAESKISPLGLIRAEFSRRLCAIEAGTTSPVRPYDPSSTGALGEGGGIVVLESLDHAVDRGAKVYAEVAGFGAGQSPSRGTPEERSIGLRVAIQSALRDADIGPDDIDAILPAALGAPDPDELEASALRSVFGERLGSIPLITITPSIGNALAGHGGIAACVGALAIHRQTLPARLHAGSPPPDLQAGNAPLSDAPLRHLLICTPAIAGQNAAVVLRRAS